MADPKYANLPGIDLDQPDVFETNDLPEDDQAELENAQERQDNDSVEQLKISPSEAFDKFKSKPGLDSSNIDFSDRVNRAPKTGYYIPRTEYEIVGEGSVERETPQQKYQRLQHEIKELGEEVSQIKENIVAETAGDDASSPVMLAKQVEYLQQRLSDLHLDKLLGCPSEIDLSDPQGALQKRLLTELEGFKSQVASSPSDSEAPESSEAGNKVTYQLYYRPEQAKFGNSARVADLEERLERLEVLLGNSPEKLSVLTTDTSNKSLLGAVSLLSAKTKLLESSQLDLVEGRLHAINQRLSHLVEKKENAEQGDKSSKMNELYDLVKKWDSMANTLPHIVERMVALQDLHEQALQFSQALSALDTAQQQISQHLQSHGDMLTEVKKTLGDNMSVIQENCSSLDSRIKTLQK